MIAFNCPKCRYDMTGPEALVGRAMTCPRCRQPFKVPVLSIQQLPSGNGTVMRRGKLAAAAFAAAVVLIAAGTGLYWWFSGPHQGQRTASKLDVHANANSESQRQPEPQSQPALKSLSEPRSEPVDPHAKANAALKANLMKKISLEKGIDANTPLGDVMEFLSDRYNVPIRIDEKAFEAIGVQRAKEQPVALPKTVDVSLAMVLERVASQLKGDIYFGTYQIHQGVVWITTNVKR